MDHAHDALWRMWLQQNYAWIGVLCSALLAGCAVLKWQRLQAASRHHSAWVYRLCVHAEQKGSQPLQRLQLAPVASLPLRAGLRLGLQRRRRRGQSAEDESFKSKQTYRLPVSPCSMLTDNAANVGAGRMDVPAPPTPSLAEPLWTSLLQPADAEPSSHVAGW
jgi:hypothetical protein